MPRVYLFTLALCALAATLAAPVTGATLSYCQDLPLATTNWTQSISVPKFDPSLGVLEQVDFSLSAHVVGSAFFESLDSESAVVTTSLSAQLSLTEGQVVAVALPVVSVVEQVSAFDGMIDFGGPSGRSYMDLSASHAQSSSWTAPSFLAMFTGPGSKSLVVSATGTSKVTGAGNLAAGFLTKASAGVCVAYTYSPYPATIADQVWIDGNANGLYEPEIGELGVNGVLVELRDGDGNLVATMLTGPNPDGGAPGWYLFDGLMADDYFVVVAASNFAPGGPLEGYAQTYDFDMVLDDQTQYPLAAGETFLGADFGYRPLCPGGTGTPGYWKNHPEAWPVEEIVIGGITYTKAQAIALMGTPEKGDKTYTMFRSLVCAKLNAGIGNQTSCIGSFILAGDAWLAQYGPAGTKPKMKTGWSGVGEPIYLKLDAYNNGQLCAPHRD